MLYTLMPLVWVCHDRGLGGNWGNESPGSGLVGGQRPSPPSGATGLRDCSSSSRRSGLGWRSMSPREIEQGDLCANAHRTLSLMPSNLGYHGRGGILAVML
jgi:hypothetical protein